MRGWIVGFELFLLTFLVGCGGKTIKPAEPRPDFYMNVYPKFIFWSLEASVKVDVFVEPSSENCHMGIAWQNSQSTWDIDERSSRLQGRIIRLRDLSVGEHKIVAVVWKCDGRQERREFTFRVLDGVP